jgi:hypothetical protein
LLSFVGKGAELKVVIGRNGPSRLLWEAARPNYPWGGEPTLTAFVWWTICTLAAAVPVGYAERRMLMTVSSSPGNLMAFFAANVRCFHGEGCERPVFVYVNCLLCLYRMRRIGRFLAAAPAALHLLEHYDDEVAVVLGDAPALVEDGHGAGIFQRRERLGVRKGGLSRSSQ